LICRFYWPIEQEQNREEQYDDQSFTVYLELPQRAELQIDVVCQLGNPNELNITGALALTYPDRPGYLDYNNADYYNKWFDV
jgi:hypothetical protein